MQQGIQALTYLYSINNLQYNALGFVNLRRDII